MRTTETRPVGDRMSVFGMMDGNDRDLPRRARRARSLPSVSARPPGEGVGKLMLIHHSLEPQALAELLSLGRKRLPSTRVTDTWRARAEPGRCVRGPTCGMAGGGLAMVDFDLRKPEAVPTHGRRLR